MKTNYKNYWKWAAENPDAATPSVCALYHYLLHIIKSDNEIDVDAAMTATGLSKRGYRIALTTIKKFGLLDINMAKNQYTKTTVNRMVINSRGELKVVMSTEKQTPLPPFENSEAIDFRNACLQAFKDCNPNYRVNTFDAQVNRQLYDLMQKGVTVEEFTEVVKYKWEQFRKRKFDHWRPKTLSQYDLFVDYLNEVNLRKQPVEMTVRKYKQSMV